jgi:hypothetical protein
MSSLSFFLRGTFFDEHFEVKRSANLAGAAIGAALPTVAMGDAAQDRPDRKSKKSIINQMTRTL